MNYKITGTGSYIPDKIVKNKYFKKNLFLDYDGSKYDLSNSDIIDKFEIITGIQERRYINNKMTTSDIATIASEIAIKDADLNKEELDYIIFAHNFGDVEYGSNQSKMLPSLASKVKANLKINNPSCVCYDLIFGCPGWVEGLIHSLAFMKSGIASRCLVIGSETLSRVVDNHDRDSMIYSDGAGATILEKVEESGGIIYHKSSTFTNSDEINFLTVEKSYQIENKNQFIKMKGRKVYEFALRNVPLAMKTCLDKSDVNINQVKKIFIHQANKKMDHAILNRFYKLYNTIPPKGVMPMLIEFLGNSSVATMPTLYDQVLRNKLKDHFLSKGDIILFASVGAGMNVNAITYQV